MLWWNLQRLKSKNPETRRQTIDALVASGNPQVFEGIRDALKDEDPEVRIVAARGLGQLKDERALTALTGALIDQHPDVRAAAAQALRKMGDSRVINSLVHALKDEDHNVRWHSANALDALGWQPATEAEIILRSVALGQPNEISDYGKLAVDALVRLVQDPTCPKRCSAIEALGRTGDIKAVKPLERALRDNDSHVRIAAIEALGQISHAPSTSALLPLLRDNDPRVRAASIESLGRMGDVRLVEPIADFLLKDSSWDVRKLAVEALSRIRHDRVPELLCRALEDEDQDVRLVAVSALSRAPDPRSIGPLILALTDENSSVRQSAKAALRQIDRQWEITEGARMVIPQLEARVKHKDYWVSQSAADTLAKLNDVQQRHTELRAQMGPEKQKRELANAVLVDALKDMDRDLRQAAAEALGRFTDISVINPLVAVLDDKDEWVGRAAALALKRLNWQPDSNDAHRTEKMKSLLMKV
jgi:HEAT repeat protein